MLKRILLAALLPGLAWGQETPPPAGGNTRVMVPGSATPLSLAYSAAEVFDVTRYCTVACSSVADQTAAFLAAAAAVNARGNATLYVPDVSPSGSQWQFNSAISGPITFTNAGVSIRGEHSVVIFVTGGSFVKYNGVTGGKISNIRLYETDNASSGAQMALVGSQFLDMDNVFLGGGFVGLEISSSLNLHGNNVQIIGNNSTSGSSGMKIHRSTSTSPNSGGLYFTNINIDGNNANGLTYGLVLNDCDGLAFTNGHIGFTSDAAVLSQFQYTNDQLSNLHFTEIGFDTSGWGIHFLPLTGQTGQNIYWLFDNSIYQIMANDAIRVDDPNASQLTFSNIQTGDAQHRGVDIEAGHDIVFSGGMDSLNNQAHGSYSNFKIGGTSYNVSVTGRSMTAVPGNPAVPYNYEITDSATNVTIVGGNLTNAATGNYNITTSSSNVSIVPGQSDLPVQLKLPGILSVTPTFATITATGGYLGNASANYIQWAGAGSGGGTPYLSATGSDASIALKLLAQGTSGVQSQMYVRNVDPNTGDIPAGLCADWNNTTAVTYKHVCNVGGTLRSVTMN